MTAQSETKFLSKKCPACGEKKLEPIPWAFGFGKKPTFHCTMCDAQLRTHVKWPFFAALPVAFAMFPCAAWLIDTITHTFSLEGQLRSLTHAVIGAASAVLVLSLILNWMVFRRWEPKS